MNVDALPTLTFRVSGVAMSLIADFLDHPPGSEAARAAQALRAATSRRLGAGRTYVVTCDVLAAGALWDHCVTAGAALISQPSQDCRNDGRALIAAAQRIGLMMGTVGWSKPTPSCGPLPLTTALSPLHGPARPETDPVPGMGPRYNRAPLRDPADQTGAPMEWALVGSPGEPTRTLTDMQVALADQLRRYVTRFPDPAGEVDDELALRAAQLITADQYRRPGTVLVRRVHVLMYVARARAQRASAGPRARSEAR